MPMVVATEVVMVIQMVVMVALLVTGVMVNVVR